MKKLLLWLFVAIGCFQVAHAAEYHMPPESQAIAWMQTWAEDQGYKLPVVRHFLVEAYYNDKYTWEQKQYIASLIRAIENISESHFRTSPWYEVENNGTLARMYGQIDESIEAKTQKLLADNPNLQTIELVYVPGSYHDENNHKAGRMIRAAWINTLIKEFGFIASGGTDLLMAWNQRSMAEWAQIWVHAWTSTTHPESWTLAASHTAHNEYLDYFNEMGISPNLYWFTLEETRPESIHWLTSSELQTYWF